jgi:hypothetical protein
MPAGGLPASFVAALSTLARACEAYREATGNHAVLVGGAATAIYTAGDFMSGDFDIVAADDVALDGAMRREGFLPEDRAGFLHLGYYHPDHPQYGFQPVSGRLFDGLADLTRIAVIIVGRDGPGIALPSVEDMIADRLGQAMVSSPGDPSRLMQARQLYRLAALLDMAYLERRVHEEGGDLDVLLR